MANGISSQELSPQRKALLAAGVVAFAALLFVAVSATRTPAPRQASTEPSVLPAVSVPRPGLTPEQELTLQALEAAAGIGVRASAATAAQEGTLRALEARAGVPAARAGGIGER